MYLDIFFCVLTCNFSHLVIFLSKAEFMSFILKANKPATIKSPFIKYNYYSGHVRGTNVDCKQSCLITESVTKLPIFFPNMPFCTLKK